MLSGKENGLSHWNEPMNMTGRTIDNRRLRFGREEPSQE
jgi:hypothetical protein